MGAGITFDIYITSERIPSSTVENVDITEENFAVRIRAFYGIFLWLQRRIEMDVVVRVHSIHVRIGTMSGETVRPTDLAIHAIGHDTILVHR